VAVTDSLRVVALPLNFVRVQEFEHRLVVGLLLSADARCDGITARRVG